MIARTFNIWDQLWLEENINLYIIKHNIEKNLLLQLRSMEIFLDDQLKESIKK